MNLNPHIPSEVLQFFYTRANYLSSKINAPLSHIFIAMVARQMTAFVPSKIAVKLLKKESKVEDDDLYGPTTVLRTTYGFNIDDVPMYVLFNQNVPKSEDDESGFTLNVHFNVVKDTAQKYELTNLNRPFEVFSALSIAFDMYRETAKSPVKNIILFVEDPTTKKKKLNVFYTMLLRRLNGLRYTYDSRLSLRESAIIIDFPELTKL